MKKIVVLFVFVLAFAFGFECFAQTGPVFNYTSPSKSELENFSLASTKKSSEYRNLLVSAVQGKLSFAVTTANVSWIFSKLFLEEVTLQEGAYQNSGWNASTQKMETSTGHAYHGFVWVFRFNGVSFPLIKGNCGNILLCAAFEAVAQTAPIQPVVVRDTVYTTVVIEQQIISSNPNEKIRTAGKTVTVGYGATNYPDNNYYQPQQQCCGGINFFYSGGGYPGGNGGYVNNHRYVDHGAMNYPAPSQGGYVNTGNPRPSNVTVGFGGGNGTSTGGNGSMPGGNGAGSGSGGRP
ncbi:MAG TPA: hypothetical protein PLO44_01510 [Candidatus Paceibacterota bacterium]|nr:hypothetical protein [Candidatus Paceibacterota bacterium]